MTDHGPLRHYTDFFGADEAVTSYLPGKTEWVATLIITEKDCQAAWNKRNSVIQEIQKEFGIRPYQDRFLGDRNQQRIN